MIRDSITHRFSRRRNGARLAPQTHDVR